MNGNVWWFWLSFYLLSMLATVGVGFWKGRVTAAVLLGYVLGPVGLLLLLLSDDKRHKFCPFCRARVYRYAYYCPRCGQKCYGHMHS
jgi:hypothetical protein